MNRVTTLALLLSLVVMPTIRGRAAEGIQIRGITVTPHIQSANMRWRRAPDPELGARVELFLFNDAEQAVMLSRETAVGFDPGRSETDLATLHAPVE